MQRIHKYSVFPLLIWSGNYLWLLLMSMLFLSLRLAHRDKPGQAACLPDNLPEC
jgi:hypothetical protein